MGELMRPGGSWMLVASGVVLAASCAKARPDVTGAAACVSWQEQIAPLFAERCGSCHTGATAAAGYDTSSYQGVLGGGSDAVPNAAAGDVGSRLLTALDPTTASDVHRSLGAVFAPTRRWVVDCDLSFVASSIHRAGILDPASRDFHGKLLRAQGYDFKTCQRCHGDDFAGGTSRVSCLNCHGQGPTACSTCHGSLSRRQNGPGAHAAHLGSGPLGQTLACNECHVVPATYTAAGHIFLADGTLDPPPAEVVLGATAALTPPGKQRAGAPSFDPATQSCSNIYCHGAVLGDTAASNTQPTWNAAGQGQADCGTCHGLPPDHQGGLSCVGCHPSVVDKDRKIVAPALHADGKVDFADPAAGCSGCHGNLKNPAPPRALSGETAPSAPGVGAHQAHLQGTMHLRGPIACNECHRVPTDVTSAGHFSGHGAGGDSVDGAEVFPVDATVGRLASADGAAPRWERTTATCSNVYCHGSGDKLGADATLGINRAPVWTATGGLSCGSSCHGSPPALAPHVPTMTRLDCVSCHPRTVDPAGVLIIAGAPGAETSAHLNGVVDVAP